MRANIVAVHAPTLRTLARPLLESTPLSGNGNTTWGGRGVLGTPGVVRHGGKLWLQFASGVGARI